MTNESYFMSYNSLQPQYVIHEAAKAGRVKIHFCVTACRTTQMFASQHYPVESRAAGSLWRSWYDVSYTAALRYSDSLS